MVKDIKIADFFYDLPEERIPRHPLEKRDECKLLLYRPDGLISHRIFKELPDLLPPGAMLVCNDTKVINARLHFQKETGASIEIFLLEPTTPADYQQNFQSNQECSWKCLVGNLKKWKEGFLVKEIEFPESGIYLRLQAQKIIELPEGGVEVRFSWNNPRISFASIIETTGEIPIPPYLNRNSEQRDLSDYQTVYAKVKGSVAAPTAGLHFTPSLFSSLEAHSIPFEKLTLHVGAGTFKPVKSAKIGGHEMHSEIFTVTLSLLEKIVKWKKEQRPIVAVGTTTVRTLETIPFLAGKVVDSDGKITTLDQWSAYDDKFRNLDTVSVIEKMIDWMKGKDMDSFTASTSIMIAPGFDWRITDILVTNFHQPGSTLLLLVSSFLGEKENSPEWRKVYKEALDNDYRFLSYGDACLFFRPVKNV